ncbi:EVE domain-containing protein [Sphingomonas phyllosphaerae]|uniref:EVE domain-containing protein n=1 Tax=Sphingomonas phyllosphaerae TaxID=257003 RepID=UPI0003B7215C|nr:EVE domain-containing protein [Sphingomonas phyllosphaerae]
MAHWLLKTEPGRYGWNDLLRERETEWTGVRNRAAAAHLSAMAVGDVVLVYHGVAQKAVVGTAYVVRTAQPEGVVAPWVSVAIRAGDTLPRPVMLAAMKQNTALAGIVMLRQSRLSVSPVTDAEWAEMLGSAT